MLIQALLDNLKRYPQVKVSVILVRFVYIERVIILFA